MNNTENSGNNLNNVNQTQNTSDLYKNPEVQTIDSHPEKDMSDKVIEKVENVLNTSDYKDYYTKEDVKNNKTNAMICYLPFVVLYFLFTGKYKKSNYLFFHANQGLNVTIIWVATFFISKVLTLLFKIDNLYIPGWVGAISYVLFCLSFVLSGFGLINTLNENSKELPVIGKIKLLK